jgi:DNA-binding NtrC family response regulator
MRDDAGTVLLLDADGSAPARTAEVLDGLGYKVVVAENAAAALKLLCRNPSIIVALVDIVLNGIDDLVGKMRNDHPKVQIIYTTGYSEMMLLDREVPERTPLLRTPLDPDRLKAAVGAVAY